MLRLRTLSIADTAALDHVRQFFRSYVAWLGVDLNYENFDREMAALPGSYAEPAGRLFYAEVDGNPAGCVGVRPYGEGGSCEMKRLYVSPEYRNRGIGKLLAQAAISAAKDMGYRRLLVDTMPGMRMAVRLYRELGFTETPCYYQTPVEGMMFLALDLENWTPEEKHNENLDHLFDFNRSWARQMQERDPEYFDRLSQLQAPDYLWIGCSDSRVPANQIVGLLPGEVFVHRNIANVVVHTDLNCQSVIQFAVDVLRVKHIMIVGHYGCGGVRAVVDNQWVGLVNLWLRHVEDVRNKHRRALEALPLEQRYDRLCELNVIEQVVNLCRTNVVQDAWNRNQKLTVHGWIYGLKDGRIKNLGLTAQGTDALERRYVEALAALDVTPPL